MKTSKTGPRLKKPGGEGLLRASPFLLPSLIGLAIFYLAPMVVSIFISLTDWNGLDRLFADTNSYLRICAVHQRTEENFFRRNIPPFKTREGCSVNKAEQAGLELREIDELAAQDSILHRLSPLSKLFVTVFYIAVTVSFPKYALTRLVWMALFPVAGYQLAGLPMRLCFQKLRMVLPLVCAVGLLNPLFDRQIVVQVGTLAVSGGVLSMLTLILKGVFCLLASFLLMATTTIEAICRALRQLHVPKLLTNLLLLTFRYVGLLLSEVAVMQQAYSLRAPGQKGIHISAWGSFLGQLLLRSMDRAQALYESMELRGFSGEFPGAVRGRGSAASWPYALVCPALMLLARYFDLSALMGGLFV